MDFLDITILCKVVDNFGDIGVVFRLAKALQKINDEPLLSQNKSALFSEYFRNHNLRLRIVCDNLESFALLEPGIDPAKSKQTVAGWQIFKWDADEICFNSFKKEQPHIILECFQCGRPDWLEKLLFEEKVPEIVNIIMVDYLTAEDYAESFHKLQSLTRSARVQKVNFMPGFTKKTGGLLFSNHNLKSKNENSNLVLFSYPRDWTAGIRALQRFDEECLEGKLNVLLAKGAGFASFKDAWEKANAESILKNEKIKMFGLTELPFLPQNQWDELLGRTPILFVRGEDSMAQACQCGVPFLWHAYPQTEEYQLVKVQALLDRMRCHFTPELFEIVEKCWLEYNKSTPDSDLLENAMYTFLSHCNDLLSGFSDFSASLKKNGDLAENLVEFILEM